MGDKFHRNTIVVAALDIEHLKRLIARERNVGYIEQGDVIPELISYRTLTGRKTMYTYIQLMIAKEPIDAATTKDS